MVLRGFLAQLIQRGFQAFASAGAGHSLGSEIEGPTTGLDYAFEQGRIITDGGQITGLHPVPLGQPLKFLDARLAPGKKSGAQVQSPVELGAGTNKRLVQGLLETEIGVH